MKKAKLKKFVANIDTVVRHVYEVQAFSEEDARRYVENLQKHFGHVTLIGSETLSNNITYLDEKDDT